MPKKTQDVKAIADYYYDLVSRNRWLIIIPFCLAMIAGMYAALVLPRAYEASTLILVKPQKVPSDYVRSIVPDFESRIATISEQILSRSNLEKIIRQYGLFSGPQYRDMFMESKVAAVREQIGVSVSRNRPGSDAFTISYTSTDAEEAMRVANGIADSFIEENLKVREAIASGTSGFLEDEMENMRERLIANEEKLLDFRTMYMGELPEQLNTNLQILAGLTNQLQLKQERLLNAENRLRDLDNQIKAAGDGETPDAKLSRLKEELLDLETKYTERHPDIIRIKSMIRQLQDRSSGAPSETGSAAGGVPRELMQKRRELQFEIAALQRQSSELADEIKQYQRRVEETPKREQELLSVRRDYGNVQDTYRSLLDRRLEAEIAVNLEKKQKGEQFQVLDRAQVPRTPTSPNLQKLLMMAVVAGLGLGGGLVFLKDVTDTSVRKPDELEEQLEIPLLTIIPKLYQPRDIFRRRVNFCFTVAGVLFALLLVSVFGLMVLNGVDQTMNMVKTIAGNYHT